MEQDGGQSSGSGLEARRQKLSACGGDVPEMSRLGAVSATRAASEGAGATGIGLERPRRREN